MTFVRRPSERSERSSLVSRLSLPSPFAVYVTLAVVFLLQLPAGFVLAGGSIRWGIILSQVGAIAVPLALVMRWRRYDIGTLLPWRRPPAHILGTAALAALLVAMATDYAVALTERIVSVPAAFEATVRQLVAVHSPAEAIEKFLLLCLLPAVIEESCFRGFCQTSLVRAYGPRWGLAVTAFLFGAAHGNPWYFPLYFGLGLFLGWLYHWRGTLWLPAIAHAVNNTWTYVTKAMDWQLPGL